MQKKIAFYHDKDIDVFVEAWLYITKPTQHFSTVIYRCKLLSIHVGTKKPVGEKSRRCCWWSFYLSIVFTRKAVIDETLIRKSTKLFKSKFGIDACKLFPYSISTHALGLYTCWDLDSETSRFTPRQHKTRSFQKIVMSCFQRTRPDCKVERF